MPTNLNEGQILNTSTAGDFVVNQSSQQQTINDNPPPQEVEVRCMGCHTSIRLNEATSLGGCNYCQNCANQPQEQCRWCGEQSFVRDMRPTYQGHLICQECFREDAGSCVGCGDIHNVDDFYYDQNDEAVCPQCREDSWHECVSCGDRLVRNEEEDDIATRCRHCREETNRLRSREPALNKIRFIGSKPGKIVGLRPFGVEIEYLVSDNANAVEMSKELHQDFGIGTDGSLRRDQGRYEQVCLEIRSPILAGDLGERALMKATKVLRDNGGSVNHSCGLHIHLATHDISQHAKREEYIKKLFYFYAVFDDVITGMLPKFRRRNHYAKLLKELYSADDILNAKNLKELEQVWYKTTNESNINNSKSRHRDDTRYCGINFHTLLNTYDEGKTLEIRYHSPTLNSTKILNWVALHQNILEHVPKTTLKQLQKANKLMLLADKTKSMLEIIKADEALKKYVESRIKLFSGVCVG